MKKILLLILFLLLLSACTPKDIITVDENGYLIVNGVKTEYLVDSDEDVITVDDEGYLVVNGIKTDYYVQNPETFDIKIGINNDGYWVINNEVTTHPQNEKLVTEIKNGYLHVFGVQTNIKIEVKEKKVSPNYQNHGGLFPDVKPEMLASQYWIDLYNNCDELIMTKEEINSFNEKTINTKNTNTVNLLNYPNTITKNELIEKINKYQIPQYNYLDNKIITSEDKNFLLEKRNINAIDDVVIVRYGIITNNTSMRSFPTDKRITSTLDGDFDYFQETGLKIGDGVIILHQTEDKMWSFVRCENYEGWIKTKDIGFCSKEVFQDFLNTENFIVVLANKLCLFNSSYTKENADITLYMGTKIPILKNPPMTIDRRSTIGCYVALIPRTNTDGNLNLISVPIPMTEDVHNGYLDYTITNLFNQAIKLLGTPYGWGDMDFNRDCSSTVSAIYKCFGFVMPRNTSNQDDLPGKSLSITNALPGSLIFTPGHVLLYLGKVDGHHYVLHNFSKYRTSPTSETYQAMCCHITTLDLYRANGATYLYSISKIIALDN